MGVVAEQGLRLGNQLCVFVCVCLFYSFSHVSQTFKYCVVDTLSYSL